MIKNKIMKKGFTLIELLVVISIIGILAGLAVVSFTSSQKQARDTSRKSDLSQYRTLLESYANKNDSLYPIYPSSTVASESLCSSLNTSLGLTSSCPEDPKSESVGVYHYQSNGSGTSGTAGATQYVLWAALENTPETSWVVCSTGESGKTTLTDFGGGNCPSTLEK